MKILFVMPKVGAWAYPWKTCGTESVVYSLGVCPGKGYKDVSVLDCKAFELSMDEMTAQVKEESGYRSFLGEQLHSYGGYAVVWYFNEAAKKIRQALPNVKIIFGGLWYSAMPTETLKKIIRPWIFVVMGEEECFDDLLEAIEKRKKKYRRSNFPDKRRNCDGPV